MVVSIKTRQLGITGADTGNIRLSGVISAIHPASESPIPVPQALESVHAGFPSVAQDYFDGDFSFDEHIIAHPDTTFIVTVAGDSMQNAGIWDGDLLVVDRALDPQDGDVVVAVLDDELTVKRLVMHGRTPVLHPENPAYPDFIPSPDQDLLIWGVVTGNYHWQRKPGQCRMEQPVPSVAYPGAKPTMRNVAAPLHPDAYQHRGWGSHHA